MCLSPVGLSCRWLHCLVLMAELSSFWVIPDCKHPAFFSLISFVCKFHVTRIGFKAMLPSPFMVLPAKWSSITWNLGCISFFLFFFFSQKKCKQRPNESKWSVFQIMNHHSPSLSCAPPPKQSVSACAGHHHSWGSSHPAQFLRG